MKLFQHQAVSTSLLALLLAGTTLTGCDRLRSSSAAPDADSAAAHTVALRVHLELLQKLGVDGLRVKVDADGDKVRLAGEVKSRATAELAEQVTSKVEGVASVVNEIHVRGTNETAGQVEALLGEAERELRDAALETRVRLALVDRLGSDGLRIVIDAASGVVTIELPAAMERARRRDARRVAAAVDGVDKVIVLDDN